VQHPRPSLAVVLGCALVLGAVGAGGAGDNAPSEADRIRFTRKMLQDGRMLAREGRLESATRVLERGLAATPDDFRLHRALADVYEARGLPEDAQRHRTRADTLDPPPAPPPDVPHRLSSENVLVALVPPTREAELPDLARWPGPASAVLEARLALRLPDASVRHADPETADAARAWLAGAGRSAISLRLDRVYCGHTIKDGHFAVARLRVAAGVPSAPTGEPTTARVVIDAPRLAGSCEAEAISRALERALEDPTVTSALEAPPPEPGAVWSSASVRALFPGLTQRIRDELARGRTLLAAGDLRRANAAFERALAIDPDDPASRSYLEETRAALALSRELSGDGVVDPQLGAARAGVERALAEERRRHDDLLAALAVLEEDLGLPDAAALATLRPGTISDREAFGPSLAHRLAGGEVEARIAYAPDGSVLARYYAPAGGGLPVVREEDTRGDGAPDRWIAYRDGARAEIYEDGRGRGKPDLHFVFAEGGDPLERVELDLDGDGQPDRLFRYTEGTLVAEERDTNGDGVLDRFDRFDDDGRIGLREEDVDGDGEIDVRSVYRGGKLVRREISDPTKLPES
jgi:Flp pilus assembly protein TadD